VIGRRAALSLFGALFAATALRCTHFDSAPSAGEEADSGGIAQDSAGPESGAPASGPLAFVQSASNGSKAASEVTAQFALPSTAHALLVVALTLDTGDAATTRPAVTDDQGDTFAPRVSLSVAPKLHYVFAVEDSKGGALSVSVRTQDGSPLNEMELYIHEYSTGGRGASFVMAKAQAGGCPTAQKDCMATDKMAAPAQSLVFGYALAGQVGPGTGFSPRETFHYNVTEDRIVEAAGDYAVTASMLASGAGAGILGAVFR
jgi:hypothetical protein